MVSLSSFNGQIPASQIGGDPELVKDIQSRLAELGYLDPPSDGLFGQVSYWALKEFLYKQGASLGAGFSSTVAELLLQPNTELPEPILDSHWIGQAIDFAEKEYGAWFCRHPACWNIIYVEGVNPDGSSNDDAPNKFNDVRAIFRVSSTGELEARIWEGTTEPGKYWTVNPMNPKGAARIAFGQYKSWRVGVHNGSHEALVQVEPVTVFRDLDKNYQRPGDKPDTGLFGINQHWGYDLPKDDLGNSSAGCLVGRTKSGHKDFMALIKSDGRFKANPGYKFMSVVVPGDKLT